MAKATLFLLVMGAIGSASPAVAQFPASNNPYTANPYAAQPTSPFSAPPPNGMQSLFPAQPAYQQPGVAVSPEGVPMGVVVPMGGGNSVIVSPDGQPIGVSQ